MIGGTCIGCLLIQDDVLDQMNKTELPIIGNPTNHPFFKQLVLIRFERICGLSVTKLRIYRQLK